MSDAVWVPPHESNGYRTCLSYGPTPGERDRSEAAVRRLLEARRRRLRTPLGIRLTSDLAIDIEDTGSEICGRLLSPTKLATEVAETRSGSAKAPWT